MPRGELPSIPDNAHLLAWDHRRRKVVAYDVNHKFLGNVATRSSSSHTKRQTKGTPCTLVDQSTLKRVEGYHLLEEYAATKWGADWDRMLTNPPEYPDNGASVCVQDVPPAMNVDGAPSCTAEESTIAGTDATTSGILPLAYERGTTTELELTVTQASTFPWLDGPMLAKVNTPSLAGNLESFPADITVLNQDTATASFNGNTLRNTTVSATASAGQTCSLTLTKTSCTGAASGRLQVAARGWLWVNYGSTRDGHYHWAISIDQVITNVEQRSSYMEFKANTKSSGVTIATPRCAFANGTTPKPASTSVESNSTPQQGVSPVLVAVPVVLGIFAFILGIVAFIIWRRRRRNATDAAPGPMTQSSNNSTYPEVRPIWLPPASSAPSTSITGHSRGQPSIDTSAGMTVSSAQGGGGYVSEKYRGAAPFNTTSPEGPLPPAYSEATVQSSSSAARSAMR